MEQNTSLLKATASSSINAYNPCINSRNDVYLEPKETNNFNTQLLPGSNSLLQVIQSKMQNNSQERLKSRDERLMQFRSNASSRAEMSKTIDKRWIENIKALNLRGIVA